MKVPIQDRCSLGLMNARSKRLKEPASMRDHNRPPARHTMPRLHHPTFSDLSTIRCAHSRIEISRGHRPHGREDNDLIDFASSQSGETDSIP